MHHKTDETTVVNDSLESKSISDIFNKKKAKKLKKSIVRNGFVLINITIIMAVVVFVLVGHSHSSSDSNSIFNQSSEQSNAPLDTISSADIAANIAQVSGLTEEASIVNQADSDNAQIAQANINQSIVTKPQLVSGGAKSRQDILTYVTKSGDSVSSLAIKFNITSDSIRWSNGLSDGLDTLAVGQSLLIPPSNGIVYKVKSGDTALSLAAKYQANAEAITEFNDTEFSNLPVGQYIFIPNGVMPSNSYASSAIDVSFEPDWSGNGYDFGYCTWYVANMVKVPNNWGNADTWAYYARLSGWIVSSTPIPGAIAQSPYMSGLGHVAYVQAVSADGTMMKYSDMNGLAGWDRVGYSGWVPISTFPNYIYQ